MCRYLGQEEGRKGRTGRRERKKRKKRTVGMIEYPVCHTVVRGGVFNGSSATSLEKLVESHNFVNRIDVIIDQSEQEKVLTQIQQTASVENLLFEATLHQIIKLFLSLSERQRTALKLITLNNDITHDNTICISKGKLTLKLRSDTYLKSGFQFKQSKFSHGNKQLKNQMYIHDFNITNFEKNVKNNSKNDIRLLWFAENIDKDITYQFCLTTELPLSIFLKPKVEEIGITIKEHKVIKPHFHQLTSCLCPDLSIVQNEDTLAELLEWLTYVTIRGTQLTENVDPFISRYPSMLEPTCKRNLTVISLDGGIIPGGKKKVIFTKLRETVGIFAIFYHGVKNVTRTFNNKNEHSFTDDGINNIVLFINDGKYVIWENTDNGDSH